MIQICYNTHKGIIMYRKAFDSLVKWKASPKRKPLILMGARQVGKTWLMNEFSKAYYPDDTVRIDLQRSESLQRKIDGSDLDPSGLIDLIQAFTGKTVTPGKTLLIIDEIQESPKALNSLKYFNEEIPDLDILVAGSLLGLSMGKADSGRRLRTNSFPVGKVSFLDIHPLSFGEFVRAVDTPARLKPLVDGSWTVVDGLRGLYETLLRKYLYVGGMPEAVAEFAKTGDYASVRRVQSDILRSYDADFVKHAPPELLGKIRLLWQNVPAQLAKENKKFVYTALKAGARAREYETALQWLHDAGMIRQVFRVSPPRLPLSSHQDFAAFKIYLHDVGLLGAMAGLSSQTLLDGNALFTNFRGSLTEQYVLQELVAANLQPHYWTSDSGGAEVDFVVQGETAVFPIEAKAGINTKAKSLKSFCGLFAPPYAIRTSLAPHKDGRLTKDVPLYALGTQLPQLLNAQPCDDSPQGNSQTLAPAKR